LFGVVGRHFTGVDLMEDALPEVRALDGVQGESHGIEAELALLFVRVVTLDAVVFEEGPVFFVEGDVRGLGGTEVGGMQGEESAGSEDCAEDFGGGVQ
jgi:hypothetical protein